MMRFKGKRPDLSSRILGPAWGRTGYDGRVSRLRPDVALNCCHFCANAQLVAQVTANMLDEQGDYRYCSENNYK